MRCLVSEEEEYKTWISREMHGRLGANDQGTVTVNYAIFRECREEMH
jgi:hypothetical protein